MAVCGLLIMTEFSRLRGSKVYLRGRSDIFIIDVILGVKLIPDFVPVFSCSSIKSLFL